MPFIHVTQQDIDRGGHSCIDCPVYQALQRHGIDVWSVSPLGLWLDRLNTPLNIHIPRVSAWLLVYDDRKYVQPFSFFLSAELFMR